MENGVGFRHLRTPSSDRFLNVFSQSPTDLSGNGSFTAGDELDEDEIFWTGDFAERSRRSKSPSRRRDDRNRRAFPAADKFGILAALPEDDRGAKPRGRRPVLCRTDSVSSSSSSSPSLLIPKPPLNAYEREGSEFSQSMPGRKFHQSAPMNVPVLAKAVAGSKGRSSVLVEVDNEEDEEEEMLPPHEIVARGSDRSPKTTCSVLEGIGRTLKGRDLRQVRNAVWHRTGFLD